MKKNKNNNFTMMLAGFLVVGMAIMSLVLFNQNKKLSAISDNLDSIEQDLDRINFDNLDQEVLGIETELYSD